MYTVNVICRVGRDDLKASISEIKSNKNGEHKKKNCNEAKYECHVSYKITKITVITHWAFCLS